MEFRFKSPYSLKYLKLMPRMLWPYDPVLFNYEVAFEMFHAKYENNSDLANLQYGRFVNRLGKTTGRKVKI